MDGYRLSLGGTSHVALTAFLERHPEIKRVTLYMDNDFGGLTNARKIKAMLHKDQRFKHIRVGVNHPASERTITKSCYIPGKRSRTANYNAARNRRLFQFNRRILA